MTTRQQVQQRVFVTFALSMTSRRASFSCFVNDACSSSVRSPECILSAALLSPT